MKLLKWIKDVLVMLFWDARPEEMRKEDISGMLKQKFKLAEDKLGCLGDADAKSFELKKELGLLKKEFLFNSSSYQLEALYDRVKNFLVKVESLVDSTEVKV